MPWTKSQIDRLGERLRQGTASPEDLRLLDDYRDSFSSVLDRALSAIRRNMSVEPAARIKVVRQLWKSSVGAVPD
jgi:hypothetical protein